MNVLKFGYSPWKYPSNWFRNIRQFFRNLKYAYQRMTRGYADPDIWDFDNYLTNLIAGGVRHLADTTHSYPVILLNDEVVNDPQKWTNYLYEMANHFENCNEKLQDWVPYEEWSDEYDQAMAMLKNSYFNLWD